MNLTPKKEFLEKKVLADAHRDLVVSARFREALNAALLDYVVSMTHTEDPVAAAAAYHSIMGAREFITHLLNIAEMSKSPPAPLPTNLDHGVK